MCISKIAVILINILEHNYLNPSFIIGVISGIILSFILWASLKMIFQNGKKKIYHDQKFPANEERSTSNQENKYKSVYVESHFERLNELNKNLYQENLDLREEIKDLKLRLDNYYDRFNDFESLPNEQIVKPTINTNFENNNEKYTDLITKNNTKITVSFSFEDKNGTVKDDDLGEMFLERTSSNNFELKYEKEIYGTAIHLGQVQFNYEILNPEKANNKPMRIIKNPLYNYDSSINKGFLIEKGRVEYQ